MILEKPFEQYFGKWLIDSRKNDRWKFFVLGINEIIHNKYDNRDTVKFSVVLFRRKGTKLLGWIGEKSAIEDGDSLEFYSASPEDFHTAIKVCLRKNEKDK
jgi:hypothetical protein